MYFDINLSALKSLNLKFQHQNEIGLLVKSADLPRFTLKTQTLNQYNRKKIVMSDHEFQPINLRFHDDRSHIINTLWQNYYSYYFADSISAKFAGAYSRTAMRNGNFVRSKYGLDNGQSIPFFNRIILYQLNKREYVSYTLVNPMITAFTHDQVQSSNQNALFNIIMNMYQVTNSKMCQLFRSFANIYTKLEKEFFIFNDYNGNEAVIYTDQGRIFVPDCVIINKFKLLEKTEKCYKDFPITFKRNNKRS